jgi:hypothetical protein
MIHRENKRGSAKSLGTGVANQAQDGLVLMGKVQKSDLFPK